VVSATRAHPSQTGRPFSAELVNKTGRPRCFAKTGDHLSGPPGTPIGCTRGKTSAAVVRFHPDPGSLRRSDAPTRREARFVVRGDNRRRQPARDRKSFASMSLVLLFSARQHFPSWPSPSVEIQGRLRGHCRDSRQLVADMRWKAIFTGEAAAGGGLEPHLGPTGEVFFVRGREAGRGRQGQSSRRQHPSRH